MSKKQFAAMVIDSLRNCPNDWTATTHTINNGGLRLWIANRPYADLTIDSNLLEIRIGSFWQRRTIRKLVDRIFLAQCTAAMTQASSTLVKGSEVAQLNKMLGLKESA